MTSSVEERREKALELHLAGASYDQIAKACGYAGRSGAYKAVQDKLKERAENVDELPQETELARLDAMLVGLWPAARRGNVQAVDRVLKIEERRAELLLRQQLAKGGAKPADEKPAPATPLDQLEQRRQARTAGRSTRSRKKA